MAKTKLKQQLISHVKHELFFNSIQSKIFAFFALISIIISLIKHRNPKLIITKLILYFILIRHLECYIYGNCTLTAWLTIILPILLIIIYILDDIPYFNKTENKLRKLYNKLKSFDFIEKIEVYQLLIIFAFIIFLYIVY